MKKLIILLLLTSLITGNLFAQRYTLPLWKGEIPNSQKSGDVEVYRANNDLIGYALVQNPEHQSVSPNEKEMRQGRQLLFVPAEDTRAWLMTLKDWIMQNL